MVQVFAGFISPGMYLGVELLGHVVTHSLPFGYLPDCFPKCLSHFTFMPAVHEGSRYSFLFCFVLF